MCIGFIYIASLCGNILKKFKKRPFNWYRSLRLAREVARREDQAYCDRAASDLTKAGFTRGFKRLDDEQKLTKGEQR